MLNTAAVNTLRDRIRAEIDDGHSHAAQFALGLHGEIVAADSFGTATPESRFVSFSATKVMVAMTLLPHLADGSIELTEPVGNCAGSTPTANCRCASSTTRCNSTRATTCVAAAT